MTFRIRQMDNFDLKSMTADCIYCKRRMAVVKVKDKPDPEIFKDNLTTLNQNSSRLSRDANLFLLDHALTDRTEYVLSDHPCEELERELIGGE